MGILTTLKARKAATKASKGDVQGAMSLFEEAVNEGLMDSRLLLSYSVLLMRNGEFSKARELMVKMQKYPMPDADKRQLFVNYASCVYKMGELQKGIEILETQHKKQPSGSIYETLGYLYVEAGDAEKALSFNKEAYEYDDEDPITLDNLGQTYYRLLNDKATAKTYFEKAISIKPSQLDTLYFLAKYDIENGDKEAAITKLEKASSGRFSPLNYATKESVSSLLDSIK